MRSRRINPPGLVLILLARVWTFLARFTGREPYYSINMVPYVFCDWNATSEKAERELGFRPTEFEEGACLTLAWYRRQDIGPTSWLGRFMVHLWREPERREDF
jgi:nucleoside-diphosphate-sugar epimerase